MAQEFMRRAELFCEMFPQRATGRCAQYYWGKKRKQEDCALDGERKSGQNASGAVATIRTWARVVLTPLIGAQRPLEEIGDEGPRYIGFIGHSKSLSVPVISPPCQRFSGGWRS